MSSALPWLRFALVLLPLASATPQEAPRSAEIVRADGRRERVESPRQDSKGAWVVGMEGRRVALPADVVAVIDEKGKESVTIRTLPAGPVAPEAQALLDTLVTAKKDEWRALLDPLAQQATSGVLDALVKLTVDAKKESRARAIDALARLRTRESVTAATRAVLAEKESATRRAAASLLFSVVELFRRCEAVESVAAGLADKDAGVRVVFAQLSPADCADALPVLRVDGLKSSDHHVRESCALELGRRGDAAGETILAAILARTKLTGVADDDPALATRLMVEEQVAVCEVFGKLATAGAKAALEKATRSPHAAVQEAAKRALATAATKESAGPPR